MNCFYFRSEAKQMMNKNSKIALITGGSKGIGWAIAQRYVKEGIGVILASRSIEDLEARKGELMQTDSKAEVWIKSTDVSQRDEVAALARFVHDQVGRLDILINNAGVFLPGEVLEEEEGALEKMMETNLYSAYHLTRDVMGLLKRSERAHIINMCSVASQMAYPNGGSYSISKFAMLGMSKAQREELKDTHIGVTAVLPGATWSDSWRGVDLPRERIIEASNIANVCYQIIEMDDNAVLEEVVIRPQKGDL